MNKYISRITSSARGEQFNKLIYPFLLATFAYGVGFAFFSWTSDVHTSSLFHAMATFSGIAHLPIIWGAIAVVTIIIGATFLMFNVPPAGRISGLVGFMLWIFAGACWVHEGSFVLLFAIAVPNMWFWAWQYFSLSNFRREEHADAKTMNQYNHGDYDNRENPEESKASRECNRGRDRQSGGTYDGPDDGSDPSRPGA